MEPALEARGWDVVVGLVEGARHHRPERYLSVHPHRRWTAIRCLSGTAEGRRHALELTLLRLKPDIAAAVNSPDLFRAANALRRSGRIPELRVAMTVHGIHPFIYADLSYYRGVVDGAVCSNRLAAKLAVVRGGLERARVHYAPHGVREGHRRQEDPPGRFRIGWVGRFEPEKRPLDLVAVVAALRRASCPFELTLLGTGTQESELRRQLEVECALASVAFAGFVDPDKVRSHVLPRLDALLITSIWETGPIVAWEAMAAGVPVVSSRYVGSGIEGALVDGETALMFDVGDAESAARALTRLWAEPGLSKRLGIAGRRLQLDRYSLKASGAAWHAALTTILQLAPRPHDPAVPVRPEAPQGRLSRALPEGAAEWLRRLVRRKGPDGGPGGEWPHAHHEGAEKTEYIEEVAGVERELVMAAHLAST
jgi:glycosyltransferase involved in cell wall biosynthesis